MFKKTLLSLAVASTLGLTGCFDSSNDNKNANSSPQNTPTALDGKTWPIFNPATSALPIPNDLLFSGTVDGTFNMGEVADPVTAALDNLSGASTVAPVVIETNGQLDPSTVINGSTVHLIELAYASGNPLQALSISEPPTLEIALTGPTATPAVRADVETVGGTSAIRIVPLKPLNPNKRYVVAITKGVKDVNGDPIIQDPIYTNITATGTEEDPAAGLLSGALAPVRTLVNNLWEPIALKYVEAIGGELSEDNIALAYSFTTSNDEKVLQYIAEPAAWLQDQLSDFLSVKAAGQAIKAGANDYSGIKSAVDGAIASFPSESIKAALSPTFDVAPPQGCKGFTGEMAVTCVSVGLAGQLSPLLPSPKGSAFNLDAPVPVGLVSAVANKVYEAIATQIASQGGSAPTVLSVQGTLSTPYFLGNTEETVETKSWSADSTLAATLNTTFKNLGLELPQGAKDDNGELKSTVVNSIFPFPGKVSDIDIPVLIIYPQGASKGVVQFQHGITTDRSSALTFGTALAALGYTVIAVDQPLHGVNSFTEDDQKELAATLIKAVNPAATDPQIQGLTALIISKDEDGLTTALGGEPARNTAISLINTVENAGSTIPGIAAASTGERHFGFDESGGQFINLTSFTTTRDNLRQSALDQMNLRASLSTLDLQAQGGTDLSNLPVYLVGHSLGTITGASFAASVNANQIGAPFTDPTVNDIKAISLLTPGAGVVRMLENSPAFAPTIIAGLGAKGIEQNTSSYTKFLNVLQGAIDSADPINFADTLEATAAYHAVVQGDLVIPNAADNDVWGIKPLKGTFTGEVNDQPVQVTIDSFPAPLSGSYPLLGLLQDLDSDGIESSPYFFALNDYLDGGTVPVDEDGLPVLSHSTPVSAQPADAFAEMVLGTDAVFTPTPTP
ncbi:hypothetical protein MARI_17090 [Marinobacter sp. JH2]|nr:hypothetical protein [Marinobacter sp. JH2]QBM17590.1 hypothetical protein MARI_17090 [Marinobacter sp. JH2]